MNTFSTDCGVALKRQLPQFGFAELQGGGQNALLRRKGRNTLIGVFFLRTFFFAPTSAKEKSGRAIRTTPTLCAALSYRHTQNYLL